jgi:hypothetical protein
MDTNSPPWIDGEVRHFIRKKYAALKKFRQSKSAARKHKLRTLTQTIKYLVRRKYREYLAKVKNYFQDNPKLFWSYHKSILHHRVSSNAEISFKGVKAKTAAHKAELFNMYFSSVFTPSRPNTHLADANNSFPLRTDQTLSDVTINVNVISKCMNGLYTSKACDPDGIPFRLLKECHQQIAPSLCDIFNHSLVSGRVASEWKSANITPMHKKKQKEPAENYRPISLLPIISKVMECCVYNRLYQHVLHLISPHQHGFLRNRSCVTQLLSSFHSIGQKLDKNTQTDILYLDFAKSFDSACGSLYSSQKT